jgi:hypothetical protein
MGGATPGQSFIDKKMDEINRNSDSTKIARHQIDIRIL